MRRNGFVSRSALAARPTVSFLWTSMCCGHPVSSRRHHSHGDAISFWRHGNRPALYSYPGAFPAIQADPLAIARW